LEYFAAMALAHGRLSLQRRPLRAAGTEWLDRALPRERLPYTWKDVIEKESLKFKELEHVLMRHRICLNIEKVDQLFQDML
jgi:hypothetical protein